MRTTELDGCRVLSTKKNVMGVQLHYVRKDGRIWDCATRDGIPYTRGWGEVPNPLGPLRRNEVSEFEVLWRSLDDLEHEVIRKEIEDQHAIETRAPVLSGGAL